MTHIVRCCCDGKHMASSTRLLLEPISGIDTIVRAMTHDATKLPQSWMNFKRKDFSPWKMGHSQWHDAFVLSVGVVGNGEHVRLLLGLCWKPLSVAGQTSCGGQHFGSAITSFLATFSVSENSRWARRGDSVVPEFTTGLIMFVDFLCNTQACWYLWFQLSRDISCKYSRFQDASVGEADAINCLGLSSLSLHWALTQI